MLKLGTVCSGIGAPEKALKRLGINFELAYWCEYDKYAAKAYEVIHNADPALNLGDLTTVDAEKLPDDLDLLVGGTPCQDFSTAGRGAGGDRNSGTRSSLMWRFVEIIRKTVPRAVLWENVPGVLTDRHRHNYDAFCLALSSAGYRVYADVLNAKLFGIPQNRERVFVVAVRRDCDRGFEFPKGYDCGVRLKDVLERNVAGRYFLSPAAIERIIGRLRSNHRFKPTIVGGEGVSLAITAGYAKVQSDGVYVADNAPIELTSQTRRAKRVYDAEGIAITQSAVGGGGGEKTGIYVVQRGKYIRRLTPLETTRLFGFDDADYYLRREAGISETQIYKQNGNSIVVNVLAAIFGELYGIDWKPLVYGKYYKTERERARDIPILRAMGI